MVALVVDHGLDEIHDLLLARSRGVKQAADLGESPIYLGEASVELRAEAAEFCVEVAELRAEAAEFCVEVAEIFPKCVEASHRGLTEVSELSTEVADLGLDLADVAVGGACQHTGCGGVLFARTHPLVKLAHLGFECGDACVEVVRVHVEKATADRRHFQPAFRRLWITEP